jgi:hypothetical protein
MSKNHRDLQQRVDDLETRVSDLESLAKGEELSDDSPAMREFVESAAPETHIERAVAIGRFLELFDGKDSFQTADIVSGYETCRISLPANPSDVLQQAEEQELIMPLSDERQEKTWQLTAKGEEFVEQLQ